MRSTIMALVAVLLVSATPAFAGGEKGQLELGIYGGHIWFESSENTGSTFFVEIPLDRPRST